MFGHCIESYFHSFSPTYKLKFQEGQFIELVLQSIENSVGKKENDSYRHVLLSVQCLKKIPFSALLQVGIVW